MLGYSEEGLHPQAVTNVSFMVPFPESYATLLFRLQSQVQAYVHSGQGIQHTARREKHTVAVAYVQEMYRACQSAEIDSSWCCCCARGTLHAPAPHAAQVRRILRDTQQLLQETRAWVVT